MASRNSAAVSSSHFADSLDCAWMELTATRNTNREQIAARFIEFPPQPPCILALYHVLEPPLLGLNSEAEDHHDLHEEKTDHQTEDTAAVRSTTTPLPALGLEATPGFLLVMAGTLYKECRPVKWRGNCVFEISRATSFEFTEREKEPWRLPGDG